MSAIPNPPIRIFPRYIYAWMGMDELGSGQIGIKQGHVPAGLIPIVSLEEQKIRKYKPQLQAQAERHGQKIYLVRFTVDQILDRTEEGNPLP